MKKILKSSVLIAAILGCGATGAMATPVLYDWVFNIDGTVTAGPDDGYDITGMPVSGTLDSTTNLGSLTWTTSAVGNHSFIAFFDYEIDEVENTFYNEFGSVVASPVAEQSWEIDEPDVYFGNILSNVYAGALDNTIGVPPVGSVDDVSMAMGWDFSLTANEMAIITLTLSDVAPQSGFYLAHFDPDSQEGIYFSSSIKIQDTTIPEPSTMLLMGAGLAGLVSVNRRKRNS